MPAGASVDQRAPEPYRSIRLGPNRACRPGATWGPQGVLLQRKAASGGSHSILFESSGWLSVEATTDRRNTMDDDDTLTPSPQPAHDDPSGAAPTQPAPTTRRRP